MPATETIPAPQELTPRQHRSVITRTLLRALAIAALLVVLYFVAPLDTALDTWPVLLLVLCLAVLAAIITWHSPPRTSSWNGPTAPTSASR